MKCTPVTDCGPLSEMRFRDFTPATRINDHLPLEASSKLSTNDHLTSLA
jgi:hypothetical protein